MTTDKFIKSKKTFWQKSKKWLKLHFNPLERLPVINWLPKYKLPYLKGDVISGISVGLLLIPQSIAIATIVGGNPVTGLYSSLAGPFVSFFFSTSPDNSVGPTVLVAIVSAPYNLYGNYVYMSTASLMAGFFVILLSILNAGVLMNFVSYTVLSAFITCGCLTIFISQLPSFLGLVIKNAGAINSYELTYLICHHIKSIKWPDFSIGFTCFTACVVMAYTMPLVVKAKQKAKSTAFKFFLEIVWFIFVAKNAILTVITSAIAYGVSQYFGVYDIITLTGKIEPTLSEIGWPIKKTNITVNQKIVTVSALGVLNDTYPLFFLAAVLMFIETLASVKNFSRLKNYYYNPTQELLNVGIANVLNAFFGGFPIGGALSRSTLNSISGVNTTFSGLITLTIVLLAIFVLAPALFYIPKAALGGMLMAATVTSMDFKILKMIYKVNKLELVPWIGTFIVGLYKLEFGMLVGFILSSFFILFREMRPRLHRIHHVQRGTGSFSVKFRGDLHFPAAEFLSKKIKSFTERFPELTELLIDCHAMNEIDISVAHELHTIIKKYEKNHGISIKLAYVKPGTVHKILLNMGLKDHISNTSKCAANMCLHCHKYHNHSVATEIDEGKKSSALAAKPENVKTELRSQSLDYAIGKSRTDSCSGEHIVEPNRLDIDEISKRNQVYIGYSSNPSLIKSTTKFSTNISPDNYPFKEEDEKKSVSSTSSHSSSTTSKGSF